MTLTQLSPTHLPALYDICNTTDPWAERSIKEHNEFFSSCGGWVIKHKDKVVGYIVLMNHRPYMDIAVHCSVLPEYHGKWMTKSIYKHVFNHIFEELKVPRCSSWRIGELSNKTFLDRLGFKAEGTIRKGFITSDGIWHDVYLYGMLPEERRWK